MKVRNLFTTGTLICILFEGVDSARIPTYRDICNETISLGSNNGAGKLVYTHYRQLNRQRCNIVIETETGHHFGYVFMETSAFRQIVFHNDHIFYTCTSVAWNEDGVERKYGCVNSNYTNKIQTTYSNTLTVEVQGDELTDFNFELIFFSLHYGACDSYEMPCRLLLESPLTYTDVCIDSLLAYDKTFNFCKFDTASAGSDIIADDRSYNGSLIAAIVLLCIIFIPLLILTFCLVYRKYCKDPEPEPEDIPTRARRLFASIIAEAHENEGYDRGQIDPSKFDPPPDYGSLEQLDGAGIGGSIDHNDKGLSQISVECPPSYGDVMKNSNEYLVSSHI
ncbi:uncharacterized protein LOC123530601 [Mercenaria mercenaria]|uniref:uncharacterized protein LOC123530601 n=1 Tax=Mercenaria mercenaria TaxID=6596 RepID=UPI00234F7FC5|nr:uncharacterized protein LOC123530601 [Mercenaria mercenaria]